MSASKVRASSEEIIAIKAIPPLNFLVVVKRWTILRLNRYLCHFLRESFQLFELRRENSFQGTLLTSTEKTGAAKLCLRLSLCGRFSPSWNNVNAREKEKKKTTIRAAAKKGSFQDNEKNGGERGNLSPPKNVLLVRLKEDFRWFEKRIRDKNCGEIKTLDRSREASSCFFFRTIVTIISCVIVVKSSGLRTSLST